MKIRTLIMLFALACVCAYCSQDSDNNPDPNPTPDPTPDPTPNFTLSNLTQITNDGYHPKWSPDGSKIVYTIWNNGNSELWLYDVNTDASTIIVQGTPGDLCPSWSPDSKKIVFDAYRSANNQQLQVWIKNIDTGDLDMVSDVPYPCITPEWSHDGNTIAFVGSGQIRLMDATTFAISSLISTPGSYTVNWSHDDSQITLPMDAGSISNIYVVDSDGSNLTRLTNNNIREGRPSFSPNSEVIAFERFTGNTADVYLYMMDNGDIFKLSNDYRSGFPDWSPDGSKIVFANSSGIWITDIAFND